MCNGACSLSSTTWRRGDCLFYFFQFAYVQWCMLPLLHNVEERAGERRQNIPKSPNTFCNCCLLSLTLSSTLWRRGNCLFYFFQFAYVQWCMLPLLHNVEERAGVRRQNIPKSPNTFCNCCLLSLTLSSTTWRRGN